MKPAALLLVMTLSATPTLAQAPADLSAAALIGLARTSRDAGDLAAARAFFERAAQRRPLSASELTELFWVVGNDAAATLRLGALVLESASGNADVRDRMITAAQASGDEAQVERLAAAGARLAPDTARWPRRLGESLMRQGRAAPAVDAYTRAVAAPDHVVADRAGLAIAQEGSGRWQASLDTWEQVPSAERRAHDTWIQSRLRSLIRAGRSAEAAEEMIGWLGSHPEDAPMRGQLVETLVRAGAIDRALDVIAPLTRGAEAERWLRREADLAEMNQQRSRAAEALQRLVALGRASVADLRRLASWSFDADDVERASRLLDTLRARLSPCDPQVLALVDRLPEPRATDAWVAAARAPSCASRTSVTERAIERLEAAGRHLDALALVTHLPTPTRQALRWRRLEGQLLLWTGTPDRALRLLEPVVAQAPDDDAARLALIDAYRAGSRAADAWAAAGPLVNRADLDPRQRAMLLEVAIEAGRVGEARTILGQLEDSAGRSARTAELAVRVVALEARAIERRAAALAEIGHVAAATRAEGRPADALRLLEPLDDAGGAVALLRAELVAQVRGVRAAGPLFEQLAARADRTSSAFTSWARATPVVSDRVAILEHGVAAFANDVDLWAGLAAARTHIGRHDAARDAADRALSLDRFREDAWMALLDASVATGAETLEHTLARLDAATADRPALALGVAQHAAGLVRLPGDPLVDRALTWLDRLDVTNEELRDLAGPLAVARVQLLTAAERWTQATAATEALVQRDARAAHLKLRAEVLSWAGRHAAAIAAYDAYLAVVPTDVNARRQQARVAAWAGWADRARSLYAGVATVANAAPAITAESAAKTAMLDGRWRHALDAYNRWLQVEPANSEATFERAQVLRATGDVAGADAVLTQLATDTGHRLALVARARTAQLRRPAFTLFDDAKAANGYAGAQLLDVHRMGAALSGTRGTKRLATWHAEAARIRASAGGSARQGISFAASGSMSFHPRLDVEASAGLSTIGASTRDALEGLGRIVWRPADQWTATATASRERVTDNLATLADDLFATSVAGGLERRSSRLTTSLRGVRQSLTDGNLRSRMTGWLSWVPREQWSGLRVVAWAETLHHRMSAPAYFSPSRFLRVDTGLELTHYFTRPRFREDRSSSIVGTYMIGTDSRGAIYQHPSVRLSWDVGDRSAIDVQAGAIRSSVYRDRSFALKWRVGR